MMAWGVRLYFSRRPYGSPLSAKPHQAFWGRSQSTWFLAAILPKPGRILHFQLNNQICRRRESNPHTTSVIMDFESIASAIPPLRRVLNRKIDVVTSIFMGGFTNPPRAVQPREKKRMRMLPELRLADAIQKGRLPNLQFRLECGLDFD